MFLFLRMLCVVIVVLFGFSAAQFTQKEGDSCKVKSGDPGVCRKFDDCDLKLFADEPGDPNICAWEGEDAIVCCPTPTQPYVLRQPQPQPNVSRRSKAAQKCDEFRKNKKMHTHFIIGGGGFSVESVQKNPHIALLGYGNPPQWQCGGTLISEKFIITAAHCLSSDKVPVTVAAMGFVDRTRMDQFGTNQQFRVNKTYKHPTRKSSQHYADIALLELDRPVKFTNAVLPACLHDDFAFSGPNGDEIEWGDAIGWGDLYPDSKQGSDILQSIRVRLVDHDNCTSFYPSERKIPRGILQESQFCAGDTGRDTCRGDSGGPLQIYDTTGMARIIGITSFGRRCLVVPGVYTRVSHYLPWIESIIWP